MQETDARLVLREILLGNNSLFKNYQKPYRPERNAMVYSKFWRKGMASQAFTKSRRKTWQDSKTWGFSTIRSPYGKCPSVSCMQKQTNTIKTCEGIKSARRATNIQNKDSKESIIALSHNE